MTQVLLQSGKSNLMLVGETGVGKTGIVEGFAQMMVGGSLPEELRDTRVIEKAHPKVLDLFLQMFDEGTLTDSQGRKCSFRESVIILTSNLGSGVAPKRRMGFVEDEECGRDAHAPVEEAIRRHLRPELVNRLTKIVHFNPLGMESAREIVMKLVSQMNERLAVAAVYDRRKLPGNNDDMRGKPATVADRRYSVRIELDESAQELILREGFSVEYGARNLERVVDQMLGTLIAQALLGGKIAAGQLLRLAAVEGRIQFCGESAT